MGVGGGVCGGRGWEYFLFWEVFYSVVSDYCTWTGENCARHFHVSRNLR